MAPSTSAAAPWTILVFQRGHAEWPLTTVCFGDVRPTHRLGSITSGVHSVAQILEIALQIGLVALHRLSIDPGTGVALETPKGTPQCLHVDMMQQGREPGPLIPLGSLVHPLQMQRQDAPALRPALLALQQAPLGLAPSLHPLVAFEGFTGTMSQSDSRPRLGVVLWSSLAPRPHR